MEANEVNSPEVVSEEDLIPMEQEQIIAEEMFEDAEEDDEKVSFHDFYHPSSHFSLCLLLSERFIYWHECS